jgi:putative ABC transport system substrate-binding protein
MRLVPVAIRDAAEIEANITEFAREPNGALVVLPSPQTILRRETIIAVAAQHRLPAIYPYRFFVTDGGLMSYGVNLPDLYKQAASYVDRLLKGAKPADLPVQAPTKYGLVINLKTAKALGLTMPASLLASAEEVIE